MEQFSYQDFVREAERLGYANPAAEKGLAIVGWRNKHGRINKFDCKIATYEKVGSVVERHIWPATTYPGLPYMLKPLVKEGVATVIPGQYVNAYYLGVYKGYLALKQGRDVRVFRDATKDEVRDEQYLDKGLFGIHIHKAGVFSSLVGHWSAGCQVFQRSEDFDTFIGICKTYRDALANSFTYTLLEY